jgi:aryl-alcohol dehydrogenase-like predicted oxidoreductase
MSSAPASRLALGTVQFGLPYGIANRGGQPTRDEAAGIVALARAAGLDTLDTAIAYGESEQRLGEIGVGGWRLVSKLPELPESVSDIGAWIDEQVAGSLRRLAVASLDGLLLHRPRQLVGPRGDALYRALLSLKEDHRVRAVGVSVYGPADLELLSHLRFDLVQAPFSVLDRRLRASGWLQRLAEQGTEVHVRSVFLQGLLLMDKGSRPRWFDRWQVLWERWETFLAANRLTALEACLGFALSHPEISRVVVGVESVRQLRGILDSAQRPTVAAPDTLRSDDPDLLDPSRWMNA